MPGARNEPGARPRPGPPRKPPPRAAPGPPHLGSVAPGPGRPAGRGSRIGTLPPRPGRRAKAGRRVQCRPRGGGKGLALRPSCPHLGARPSRAAGLPLDVPEHAAKPGVAPLVAVYYAREPVSGLHNFAGQRVHKSDARRRPLARGFEGRPNARRSSAPFMARRRFSHMLPGTMRIVVPPFSSASRPRQPTSVPIASSAALASAARFPRLRVARAAGRPPARNRAGAPLTAGRRPLGIAQCRAGRRCVPPARQRCGAALRPPAR